jgi:hypothetical protein
METEKQITNRLRARGLKPIKVLAANRPHGDRLRYQAGCKCRECRRANSRYESERQKARRNGDWNGIVGATLARRHILKLSRRGIGRRAVSIAADVSENMIGAIKSKRKKQIRARSERRILAVTQADARDHSLVPAGRTWKLLRMLKTEGYKTEQLARQLGYAHPAIQFRKTRVLVRTAFRVEHLYRQLTE